MENASFFESPLDVFFRNLGMAPKAKTKGMIFWYAKRKNMLAQALLSLISKGQITIQQIIDDHNSWKQTRHNNS